VVVNNFNIVGIAIDPAEANPPLIINPNAVLPSPIACQLFEPVGRRHSKVRHIRGCVQDPKLSQGNPLQVSWQSAYRLPSK
jgi:hypothetical protein